MPASAVRHPFVFKKRVNPNDTNTLEILRNVMIPIKEL
jgi:hypothetical protein